MCDQCDYIASKKHSLQLHINAVHLKVKPFACDQCYSKFARKKYLNKHKKRFHLESPRPPNKAQLQKLIDENRKLVNLQNKPFTCDLCEYSTQIKYKLKCHINDVHLKLKPFACDKCDLSFARRNYLTRHIQVVHMKTTSFACDQCDQSFLNQSDLLDHVEIVHLDGKPFTCGECESAFSSRQKLEEHKKFNHLGLKPLNWQECQSVFADELSLKKHIEVHSTKRCDQCESSNTAMSQSVTENYVRLTCNKCYVMFCCKTRLLEHEQKRKAETKRFPCGQCHYSASRKTHLQIHVNAVHLNLRPFHCDFESHIKVVHDIHDELANSEQK